MTEWPKIVVMASGNQGKLREIAQLLHGLGIEVRAQSEFGVDEADESSTSFVGNSLLKARHAVAATGLPAIADDSGLVVDALGGAPGVHSARYSGIAATDDSNVDKLLAAMQHVDIPQRTAAFHCAASFVVPGEENVLLAEGVWSGSILAARQGNGGFGYDPVFFDPQSGNSAALLSTEEKNARSHRGHALRGLVALIKQQYA